MDILSLISIFLFLIYLQAGIYVLRKNLRSRLNQLFFLSCVVVSVWSFGYVFAYPAQTAEQFLYWERFASVGYLLFPAFMTGFNLKLCNCSFYRKAPVLIVVSLVLTGIFLIIVRLSGLWVPHDVIKIDNIWHILPAKNSPYYILLMIYLVVAITITLHNLLRWRKSMSNAFEIRQFYLFFFTLVIFALTAAIVDILLPVLEIYVLPPLAHISSILWFGAISYAMVKYRLMGTNTSYHIADNIIRHLKEIVLFINRDFLIVRSNSFTEKLLAGNTSNLEGKDVSMFFENRTLIAGYLHKAETKGQIGPLALTMKDISFNSIETSLYFMVIKDRFNDLQGFIIYGHDNREAINLQKEIIVRQHAEKNLRAISDVLEVRVKERTGELTESYKELQVKMTERMRVEEQIKADIAEKEILINEIHNRVKNNMNIIISLILAYDKENLSAAASRKFKELAQRVKTLLQVHHNLYLSISYSDVDFTNFLKILTEELIVFHRRKDKVEVKYDLSEVFLDVDYAIPMGIIVNELISNSLQHGFSDYYLRKHQGEKHILHIRYACVNNSYEISVTDNGKGIPPDFDISGLTTIGLPLTDILVKDQINGTMEVHSSDHGTMFKINFLANK